VDCHSRVPSGVPLPADGLSAASGLYTSRWAEVARTLPQGETELSGATAHFPNLKSRYSEPQATRKKGSFEKLHFSLTRGLAQVSHWRKYKSGDLPFAVRSSVNLVRERGPIKAPRPAGGIRRGSTVMSVTATTGMVIPERRPDGLWLQSLKVTQRSFDLRRPLRMRFAPSGDGQIPINSP
jgi:hypothetical protein